MGQYEQWHNMPKITNVRELAMAYRNGPYAWPGGYPIYPLLSDGYMLCWECFKTEYRLIQDSVRHKSNDGWCVTAYDILYETEGPEFCGHCGVEIESAYGDILEMKE